MIDENAAANSRYEDNRVDRHRRPLLDGG